MVTKQTLFDSFRDFFEKYDNRLRYRKLLEDYAIGLLPFIRLLLEDSTLGSFKEELQDTLTATEASCGRLKESRKKAEHSTRSDDKQQLRDDEENLIRNIYNFRYGDAYTRFQGIQKSMSDRHPGAQLTASGGERLPGAGLAAEVSEGSELSRGDRAPDATETSRLSDGTSMQGKEGASASSIKEEEEEEAAMLEAIRITRIQFPNASVNRVLSIAEKFRRAAHQSAAAAGPSERPSLSQPEPKRLYH